MWKLATFAIVTSLLAFISRTSLSNPGTHGFYRFFAWECILVLLLLNAGAWFTDPFSWHQLIAWALLFSSLVPLILGVRSLRAGGQTARERSGDPSLFAFERTTKLVKTGIYASIRHPLYSSLLLLTWGTFFKAPGLFGGMLALIATTFLVATAKADEKECLRFFGTDYRTYMHKTKRFIPYVF